MRIINDQLSVPATDADGLRIRLRGVQRQQAFEHGTRRQESRAMANAARCVQRVTEWLESREIVCANRAVVAARVLIVVDVPPVARVQDGRTLGIHGGEWRGCGTVRT